jgi:amino acid permease
MNFKPTRWKLILGIIILILIVIYGYFGSWCIPGPCSARFNMTSSFMSFIYIGIPAFVIFYLVYSLFQKK